MHIYPILSVIGLSVSCRSVTVCTKRAGSEWERAESHAESGRPHAQERQIEAQSVGVMNVGVVTEAASRGLRARGLGRGRLYIRANDRSFDSECHAECWAKSRRLRAQRHDRHVNQLGIRSLMERRSDWLYRFRKIDYS